MGPLARLAIEHEVSPSIARRWAGAEGWSALRRAHEQAVQRQLHGQRVVERALAELQRTAGLDRYGALRVVVLVAASLELLETPRGSLEVA